MVRGIVFLVLSLVLSLPVALSAVPLDPRGAGIGGAYTAFAAGPLASLRNPAGIIDSPGVHVAVGALIPAAEELGVGVSVATGHGPAVAWTSGGGRIQGTFAFYASPAAKIGLGISYLISPAEVSGISLSLGGEYSDTAVFFGGSIYNLGAGIFGAGPPLSIYLGAAVEVFSGIVIAADLHLISEGSEVAIGGEASFWLVRFRWGMAVYLSGGFCQAGIGLGGELFGVGLELAGGLDGLDHRPFLSFGVNAGIPAWW